LAAFATPSMASSPEAGGPSFAIVAITLVNCAIFLRQPGFCGDDQNGTDTFGVATAQE
jgi:hypothetical protein